MTPETSLITSLGLKLPVIQAPMAGGGDTAQMVAAVGEAGGLGYIGAAYLAPAQIEARGREVAALTSRTFGINLFAPQPVPSASETEFAAAVTAIAPYYDELGLEPPTPPAWTGDSFRKLLPAAISCGASHFSFTFGLLPAEAVSEIKNRGMTLAGTATSVAEALALAELGVDAIIAQGSEAGGHRGTFDPGGAPGMVGTMALVPQIVDAVELPVIASGGIMDGRGIAAALALGAQAVQLGTAFLTCDEAGIPEAYKNALLAAEGDDTGLTRAFSGRWARGIVNRVMREVPSDRPDGPVLPFPLQNSLTRPLRDAAREAGRAEFLSLWAGQGVGLARRTRVADLMQAFAREIDAARRRDG